MAMVPIPTERDQDHGDVYQQGVGWEPDRVAGTI